MTFALGLLLWLTVSATFAFGISRLPRVTVEPERNEAAPTSGDVRAVVARAVERERDAEAA